MKYKGRVLFIIHDNYQDDNVFPLGVGYLAAVLRKYGANVSIYCQDVFHYTNDELAEYLKNHEFDLIGLGFMAARFKMTVKGLCEVINNHKKNAWLVLGGHGPTPIPEYILETTQADVVAMGEAEETIVELLHCKLNHPDKISDVKGVAYRIGKKIVVNERRKPVTKLSSLPFPEWELFPMEHYTTCLKFPGMNEGDKAFPIISVRGCINRCSFCYRLEKGIRNRDLHDIIEEIKILNNSYGINYFYFVDELSIPSKKRIFEFARLLEKNKLKIMYRMTCRVDIFDEEIAKCLKDSGCMLLNIGFESTDQNVLDMMKKNVTVEQNIRAAEIANKYGIGLYLSLIWGLPGDTEKSLRNNVEFIKKYNTYDQIRTIRCVTPYPGSPLYYEAIRKGLLTGPKDFFEKFKNADLYMVNFMNIPEKDIYQMLFEVNRDLILDHYKHTNGDMEAANRLIKQFYSLYFKEDLNFRGPRFMNSTAGLRERRVECNAPGS
jgi:radical SAM superfamily enzyme YgiQ (UPF0313 family)